MQHVGTYSASDLTKSQNVKCLSDIQTCNLYGMHSLQNTAVADPAPPPTQRDPILSVLHAPIKRPFQTLELLQMIFFQFSQKGSVLYETILMKMKYESGEFVCYE